MQNLTNIRFGIILKSFNINFSGQEHQIDYLYVSINSWNSQVSSNTPFHISFTVPLKNDFIYLQVGSGAGASSPDSSSDSSSGSPQHNMYDGPNVEAEACLPGVILSSQVSLGQVQCSPIDQEIWMWSPT